MIDHWQAAFDRLTYGIYVLTTHSEGIINGMIASWAGQISHAPPLIMAAVHPNRYTREFIEASGVFALHVLERSQTPHLKRFKGPVAAHKFNEIDWHPGQTGCPILEHSLAWFDCRVTQTYRPGNHVLYVGEVIAAGPGIDGEPLTTLDYEGRYTGQN